MRHRHQLAISYAVAEHVTKRGQMYGLWPFSHHLNAVLDEVNARMEMFLAAGFTLDDFEDVQDAAVLHDIREDCEGVKPKHLIERFGEKVAAIVELVTDEKGENRKIRKLLTYGKLRGQTLATFVKLCDRIANIKSGGSLMKMYRSEFEEFERAVRIPGEWDSMWDEVAHLLLIGDRTGMGMEKEHVRNQPERVS